MSSSAHGDRGERHIVVVEIVDHRTYDLWFQRRGR